VTDLKEHGPARRVMAMTVALVVVLGAVVLANMAWRTSRKSPRCEDAWVHAETVGIAARVPGPLVALRVEQGSRVKAGEILLEIDPAGFDLAVRQAREAIEALDAQIAVEETRDAQLRLMASAARADVEAATAQVEDRRATLRRVEPLAKQGFATDQELDIARTAVATAESLRVAATARASAADAAVSERPALVAKRKGLVTALAVAELEREHCVVRAPGDGVVVDLDVAVGTHAVPGMTLFKVLLDGSWAVDAPYREGELERMRAGDEAEVRVMTAPNRIFRATVESIGVAVRPTDETVLNGMPFIRRELDWVRVAQRFPVRLRLEDADASVLRMGASAVVVIHPSGS
jgi:multidrug efflux system membrane fusion protein